MVPTAPLRLGLALSALVGTGAVADHNYFSLLTCSTEYQARAEFNRGLGLTNQAHQLFLISRSDLFLELAETRAPLESAACPGRGGGLRMNLLYCRGRADLWSERRTMTDDRLIEMVESTAGVYPLEPCMEDDACAPCIRILDEIVLP
jgi:hypothetical protein